LPSLATGAIGELILLATPVLAVLLWALDMMKAVITIGRKATIFAGEEALSFTPSSSIETCSKQWLVNAMPVGSFPRSLELIGSRVLAAGDCISTTSPDGN
jgi:hypothetical protein